MQNKKIPEAEASGNLLEVTTRFELVDEGFADPCLTTWPRHHIGSDEYQIFSFSPQNFASQIFAGTPLEIRVGGCRDKCTGYAAVAHLVERHLAKVEVASSSLVGRSNTKPSLMQRCKNDGFFVSRGNGRECPQRRASVGSGAASAVFHHDPTCEKGVAERPQAFRYSEI